MLLGVELGDPLGYLLVEGTSDNGVLLGTELHHDSSLGHPLGFIFGESEGDLLGDSEGYSVGDVKGLLDG